MMRRFLLVVCLCVLSVNAIAQPSTQPLVQQADLVYQGAFRVPLPDWDPNGNGTTFAYAGSGLAFNPAHTSLFLTGHDAYQLTGEISIPAVGTGAVGSLVAATLLQPLVDVAEGRRRTLCNPTDPNAQKIGGYQVYGGKFYFTCFSYYDGGHTQILSHFVSGLDLSVTGDVTGPFQVGTTIAGSPSSGFVAGYMGDVPQAWQAALGGPVFTGLCCVAIVGRTSSGPSVSTINPADIGVTNPVPMNWLLGYPITNPLGGFYTVNPYYNGSTEIHGVVMPVDTRSVLFFGRHGTTFCYGAGTSNAALDHLPVPNEPGVIYCYDPDDPSKGTHGYPYLYQVWAYDANDLVAVKAGTVKPWEVKPYAVWPIVLPYTTWSTHINGAAYDPTTQRIFLEQGFGNGAKPVIHVLKVTLTVPPPPPPPPPPPTVTVTKPCTVSTTGTAIKIECP